MVNWECKRCRRGRICNSCGYQIEPGQFYWRLTRNHKVGKHLHCEDNQ